MCSNHFHLSCPLCSPVSQSAPGVPCCCQFDSPTLSSLLDMDLDSLNAATTQVSSTTAQVEDVWHEQHKRDRRRLPQNLILYPESSFSIEEEMATLPVCVANPKDHGLDSPHQSQILVFRALPNFMWRETPLCIAT